MVMTGTPADKYRFLLEFYHQFFTNHRRRHDTSIGYEGCVFLWDCLENSKPTRVLDLGSGLSSCVIRLWKKLQEHEAEIFTVDHDQGWLSMTERDFIRLNLHLGNTYTLHKFLWELDPKPEPFDLVFVDHGKCQLRIDTFQEYLPYLAPDGLFVFDDWHKEHLRVPMKDLLLDAGFKVTPHLASKDLYGRYLATAERV